MEAKLFYRQNVPCLSDNMLPNEICFDDELLSLNPDALTRIEPGGSTILSPNLYSYFFSLDQEMTDLLLSGEFNARGLPGSAIQELKKHNILIAGGDCKPLLSCKVEEESVPIQALLEITSCCNCECLTCYHGLLDGSTPSYHQLILRIAKLKELGLCLFEVTGGEPTLRSDLGEILNYIHDQHVFYYIVTNGEFLADLVSDTISTMKSSLGLAVSLDGTDKVHDNLRGRPGLFRKMLIGLDRMMEFGVPFYFVSTINEMNIETVPDMISLAKKYNTTLQLRPTIRAGNAMTNNLGQINVREILGPYLDHPNVRNSLFTTKKNNWPARFYGCRSRSRIAVDVYGRVLPCVMDRSNHLDNVINYSSKTLAEALEQDSRRILDKSSICRYCRFNEDRIICSGFCRFSRKYSKSNNLHASGS